MVKEDWRLLLQALYFVKTFEVMFPTERLKISKCQLETKKNLASSVKPTIKDEK